MAKTDQNFSMYAGDSKDLIVTVLDDNGAPVDLTGAVVKWALYRTMNSPTADASKSSLSDGITITDPRNGVFTVSISHDDTKNLAGNYFHTAQVTDARNYVTVVMTGKANIEQTRKFQ